MDELNAHRNIYFVCPRKTLNTDTAFVSPPTVHSSVPVFLSSTFSYSIPISKFQIPLINRIIKFAASYVLECLDDTVSQDGSPSFVLHALNSLGAVLVGSKVQFGTEFIYPPVFRLNFVVVAAKWGGCDH